MEPIALCTQQQVSLHCTHPAVSAFPTGLQGCSLAQWGPKCWYHYIAAQSLQRSHVPEYLSRFGSPTTSCKVQVLPATPEHLGLAIQLQSVLQRVLQVQHTGVHLNEGYSPGLCGGKQCCAGGKHQQLAQRVC